MNSYLQCLCLNFLFYIAANPNPLNIAGKLKNIMVGIGSAMCSGVGIFLGIHGIQNLAIARESHDTGTMLTGILKCVAGVGCLLAGGIAYWFVSKKY